MSKALSSAPAAWEALNKNLHPKGPGVRIPRKTSLRGVGHLQGELGNGGTDQVPVPPWVGPLTSERSRTWGWGAAAPTMVPGKGGKAPGGADRLSSFCLRLSRAIFRVSQSKQNPTPERQAAAASRTFLAAEAGTPRRSPPSSGAPCPPVETVVVMPPTRHGGASTGSRPGDSAQAPGTRWSLGTARELAFRPHRLGCWQNRGSQKSLFPP